MDQISCCKIILQECSIFYVVAHTTTHSLIPLPSSSAQYFSFQPDGNTKRMRRVKEKRGKEGDGEEEEEEEEHEEEKEEEGREE